MKGIHISIVALGGLLLLHSTLVKSEIVGSLEIGGDTVYIWRRYGTVSVIDNGVFIKGNSGAYFLANNVATISPEDYHQVTK